MEDSRVRRSELPRVWPNPGSSGPMAKRWRLPSASSRGSTVGRWMTSMGGLLLRVELDDELLAHGHVDLLAQREVAHRQGGTAVGRLEPGGHLPVDGVEVVPDHDHGLGLVPEGHDLSTPEVVRGDGHPLAVDRHVAVAHELAGLGPARPPPGAVDDVVEAGLEHPQQDLAGDALLAHGLGVEVAELLLHEAVDAAGLLLLPQLDQVLGVLAAQLGAAVVTGRVGAPLDRALERVALGALEEQLHLLPPAQAADGTGVAGHGSDPPALRRAAAVV